MKRTLPHTADSTARDTTFAAIETSDRARSLALAYYLTQRSGGRSLVKRTDVPAPRTASIAPERHRPDVAEGNDC